MKSIGEVSAFISDGDWIESKDQSERGIRLLQVGNIGLSEFIPKDERAKYISEETYAKLNCTEIFPGDILISRLPEPVGRACIVPDGLGRCITAVDCTILRLNESECDKRYFINYTQSPTYFFKLKRFLTGTTRIRISRKNLESVEIPLPPLDVQRRIAETLDKVTELISLRKTQLGKLDELVKARFVEMFGDLASPECKWNREKLVDACVNSDDIKCGPFGTQLSKDEYVDTGVAVWEIPQINSLFVTTPTHYLTEEKARQLEAYSIKSGDIAMSRKGNVGKCAVFPSNFEAGIIHSDVLRIRVDDSRVLPLFMMHQLHYSGAVQHQIELVSSGAIMAGINVTKLKQIFIHIPPMELQNQFVAFVEQTDKSKAIIQQSLDTLETLKKSLMQEYFG